MLRPRFFCVIFVMAVTVGCNNASDTSSITATQSHHSDAIQEVFRLDFEFGQQLHSDSKQDPVVAVQALVRNLRGIDLRACPPEFQEAYLKHCYAWADLIPLVTKYDGLSGTLTAFLEGVAGEYNGDEELARILDRINSTALDVERIGLRYGVQLKHP